MRTSAKPQPALQSAKETFEAVAGIAKSSLGLVGGMCTLGVDIVEGWQDTNRQDQQTDLIESITVNAIAQSTLMDEALTVVEARYEGLDKVDTSTLSPRQLKIHEARLSVWDSTTDTVMAAPKVATKY